MSSTRNRLLDLPLELQDHIFVLSSKLTRLKRIIGALGSSDVARIINEYRKLSSSRYLRFVVRDGYIVPIRASYTVPDTLELHERFTVFYAPDTHNTCLSQWRSHVLNVIAEEVD